MYRTYVRAPSRWLRSAALAIGIVGFALTLSGQTHAQKPDKWAQVGGWEIRVDQSVGSGCFAIQTYEDGTVVRMGVDVSDQRVYLRIFNQA